MSDEMCRRVKLSDLDQSIQDDYRAWIDPEFVGVLVSVNGRNRLEFFEKDTVEEECLDSIQLWGFKDYATGYQIIEA